MRQKWKCFDIINFRYSIIQFTMSNVKIPEKQKTHIGIKWKLVALCLVSLQSFLLCFVSLSQTFIYAMLAVMISCLIMMITLDVLVRLLFILSA